MEGSLFLLASCEMFLLKNKDPKGKTRQKKKKTRSPPKKTTETGVSAQTIQRLTFKKELSTWRKDDKTNAKNSARSMVSASAKQLP